MPMKIVTIGGGTGQFTLLSALRESPNVDITAIVSMVDSGGSTGRLRDEYGVLPPGDILKCLIALSSFQDAREILQARFSSHEKLAGHNAGNLLLTFLSQHLGNDFSGAVVALGEILQVKGRVIPVTTDKATLVAELENGRLVYSETAIDVGRDKEAKIKRTFLVPHSGKLEASRNAIEAIETADMIIVGPGDLYTSIVPNFLVPGIKEAIEKAPAKLVYVANLMTKFGETRGFSLRNFVDVVEGSQGRSIDIVIANNKIPELALLEKYLGEGAEPVRFDLETEIDKRQIILEDLISEGDLARHDVEKLREVLMGVVGEQQV